MNKWKKDRPGYSLVELLAVSAILGVLAAIIIPRVFTGQDTAKASACHVNQGDIEIQVELWLHNTGSLPASDLTDIGADLNYFPEGVSVCPVDGSAYSIDPLTGLVVGHNH